MNNVVAIAAIDLENTPSTCMRKMTGVMSFTAKSSLVRPSSSIWPISRPALS